MSCLSPVLANDNLSGLTVATFLAAASFGARSSLLVPIPVHSRNDRGYHVARAKPRERWTHPPWFGVDVHWRRGWIPLQEESPGKCRD